MVHDYKLVRLKAFDSSFLKAIQYYKDHANESKADAFENAVYHVLGIIIQLPRAYQVRYKDIRAGIVPNFPYLILYRINEPKKRIEFTRIVSQKSDWLKN